MTWLEFWASAAANAVGSIVGVFGGVTWALIEERRRRAREAAVDRARAAHEEEIENRRLKAAADTAEKERCVRGFDVMRLVIHNIKANVDAVRRAEIEVGNNQPVHRTGIDLQTWEVVKPIIVDAIDNPTFAIFISRFFAKLAEYRDMLLRRALWQPGYVGYEVVREELKKLGPELRDDADALLPALSEWLDTIREKT